MSNDTETNMNGQLSVSAADLRRNLSEYANRVAFGGVRVVLERHGKPVLALVSVEDLELLERIDRADDAADAASLAGERAEDREVVSLAALVSELAPELEPDA